MTLAMLAYAFLVVIALTERAQHPPPPGVIALACSEIQHLFAALVGRPVDDWLHRLRWSWWRRLLDGGELLVGSLGPAVLAAGMSGTHGLADIGGEQLGRAQPASLESVALSLCRRAASDSWHAWILSRGGSAFHPDLA